MYDELTTKTNSQHSVHSQQAKVVYKLLCFVVITSNQFQQNRISCSKNIPNLLYSTKSYYQHQIKQP